jgi:hypothetical protein
MRQVLITAALLAATLHAAQAATPAESGMIPLVIASGPLAGLGESIYTLGPGEPYDAAWQPPPGFSSLELDPVHAPFPDALPAAPNAWAYVGGAWEASLVDLTQPGGHRPPTLEELRAAACQARELHLGDEWRSHLNAHRIGDPQALDCALGMSSPASCQALTTARTAARAAYESQSAALLDPTAARAYCAGYVAAWPEVRP